MSMVNYFRSVADDPVMCIFFRVSLARLQGWQIPGLRCRDLRLRYIQVQQGSHDVIVRPRDDRSDFADWRCHYTPAVNVV